LLVLLLHTATVTKDLGDKAQVGGGEIAPCPNVKPRLTDQKVSLAQEHIFYDKQLSNDDRILITFNQ